LDLQFPFMEISDANFVFPVTPNRDDLIAACPDDIDGKWAELVAKIIHDGLGLDGLFEHVDIRARNQEEADTMARYLSVVMRDYGFKYQVKVKVAAWLLSIMLPRFPEDL
jgi:hypothetical protein